MSIELKTSSLAEPLTNYDSPSRSPQEPVSIPRDLT